jgi:hypothetical protein
VTTPPGLPPLLTVPYVGIAEFRASPTFMDSKNLVTGGLEGAQDAELYNQLLKASSWADGYTRGAGGSLRAHAVVENTTARVDKFGRIWVHPKETPVRSITALSYGTDLNNMTSVTSFNGTTSGAQTWVEDQRGVVIVLSGLNANWAGPLQFGAAPPATTQVYVQFEYVAGWANAQLQSATATTSPTATVDTSAGFQAPATSLAGNTYGASIARIWDPAQEEALLVSAVPNATSVTFSANFGYVHQPGVQISEFPAEVRTAVTQYATGLMLREAAQQDMPFPGSPGPTARRSSTRGVAGGLIDEAEKVLCNYKRVR